MLAPARMPPGAAGTRQTHWHTRDAERHGATARGFVSPFHKHSARRRTTHCKQPCLSQSTSLCWASAAFPGSTPAHLPATSIPSLSLFQSAARARRAPLPSRAPTGGPMNTRGGHGTLGHEDSHLGHLFLQAGFNQHRQCGRPISPTNVVAGGWAERGRTRLGHPSSGCEPTSAPLLAAAARLWAGTLSWLPCPSPLSTAPLPFNA